jgi:hypothetical protein
MKKLLVFIAGICLLFGCSKSDQFYGDDLNSTDLNDMSPKCNAIHKGPINLKGITGFGFYSAKEHKVLADPYVNYVDCTAELTFGDKHKFVLHTKEGWLNDDGSPFMYREIYFDGKILPSGELKFSWPMTFKEFDFDLGDYVTKTVGVLPEIRLHTGCVLFGTGINNNTLDYKGYFRKNKFFADTHFMGIQKVPGELGFNTEIVPGITMIHFLIDLDVVPD